MGVDLVDDGLGFVLRGGDDWLRGERGVFDEEALGEGAEDGFAGEAVRGGGAGGWVRFARLRDVGELELVRDLVDFGKFVALEFFDLDGGDDFEDFGGESV